MAIKCNCPNKCEIHPAKVVAGKAESMELGKNIPIIELADQFQLKKLEGEVLKATLRQRDAGGAVQAHQQQLQIFAATLYDKHGIKQEDWFLDLDKAEFVNRPPSPAQKG